MSAAAPAETINKIAKSWLYLPSRSCWATARRAQIIIAAKAAISQTTKRTSLARRLERREAGLRKTSADISARVSSITTPLLRIFRRAVRLDGGAGGLIEIRGSIAIRRRCALSPSPLVTMAKNAIPSK